MMIRLTKLFISILLFAVFISPSRAQESQSNQRQLPQIELEDYTIIGLEKVVLPHKVRRTMSKKLVVDWSQNSFVRLKQSPAVSFRSVEKPGVGFLYEFPFVNAVLEYGSFNTIGAKLSAKTKAGAIIPFISIDFENSDGHVNNADYTKIIANGGLEGQAWQNSVFQFTTRFRNDRQNLWSNQIPADSVWEKKITVWQWGASLDQKLSDQFSFLSHGNFQIFDYENRFKYNQNCLSVSAGIIFKKNNTSILAEGILDQSNSETEFENSNVIASQLFNNLDYSLYSSNLKIRQKITDISLAVGFLAQHLEVKNNSNDSKTELFPFAELTFNSQNILNINMKYQPGVEFQTMEQMLEENPFADFGSYQPLKHKHKVIGKLDLNISTNLGFQLSSSYSEFENYPVIYSSYFDTTGVIGPPQVFSTLNYMYPYWEYRYINEAKILENFVGISFLKRNKFLLEGWIIYRWHEMNTLDEHNNAVTGNEIPYLPMISSDVKFNWFLFNKHKLQISGKYVGQRYNDVGNSIKLRDYFLVNASIRIKVAEQFFLRFFGNNLLNHDFEDYHTYIAPGISGGAGVEIKL